MKSLLLFLLLTSQLTSLSQDTLFLKKYVADLRSVEIILGDKPYTFLFDTGGGETFISPEIATALGKKVYGQGKAFRMDGEIIKYQKCDDIALRLSRQVIHHSTLGVWDVMALLPKEFPRIDGVLSLKSFRNMYVTLDLGHNHIIAETHSSFKRKIKTMTPLQVRFANGLDGNELTIFIALNRNGKQYWFLLDSGNLDRTLLSHGTAFEWGFESDSVKIRQEFPAIEMNIANKSFKTTGSSTEILYDGALNFEFISQHRFCIDFTTNQVWFE